MLARAIRSGLLCPAPECFGGVDPSWAAAAARCWRKHRRAKRSTGVSLAAASILPDKRAHEKTGETPVCPTGKMPVLRRTSAATPTGNVSARAVVLLKQLAHAVVGKRINMMIVAAGHALIGD